MSSAELSNRELVSRLVAAGPEDSAWLEFFTRFSGPVRQTAYRALMRESQKDFLLDVSDVKEIAEDVTQEVFVRLLDGERRALAHFRGATENSLFAYLRAITINLVRDQLKTLRAQRRPQIAVSLDESKPNQDGVEGPTLAERLECWDLGPDVVVEESELRKRVSAAVDAAAYGASNRRDRLIFRLYFLEGLSVDEMASIASIKLSSSGIEKRIKKMRSLVKKALLGQGG